MAAPTARTGQGRKAESSAPCLCKECRRSARLMRVDRNPPRQHGRLLGNLHLEHAIDELRLDGSRVRGIWQAEAAEELTADALNAAVAVLLFARLAGALSTNRQHSFLQRDVDVL